MTTFMPKAGQVDRKWYVVDATNKTLGRLASEVASLLRGKHKPIYTPSVDTGDHVIVINAEKIRLTGNKLQQKQLVWHTGYPGGLKSIAYRDLLRTRPERAIEVAVKGMIPHNRLGRKMIKKLKVYRGPEHPHQAQKPEMWEPRGF
ncbi:MAG: 50S ribosomal protein L13 [Firmicutes bacterium]|nr:50S ribosomal protein L13 [Bacillota bacterium]